MIPVMQSNLSSTEGDCFAACVASILEVSLSDIPNFMLQKGDKWWDHYNKWLLENYNCVAFNFELDSNNREEWISLCIESNLYCMGTIKCSNRLIHSVVLKSGNIVHNPWPYYGGDHSEFTIKSIEFIVPLDPSKIIKQRTKK